MSFIVEPQAVMRPGIIELRWGDPDPALIPVAAIRDAADWVMDNAGAAALNYGLNEGPMALRQALAERLTTLEGCDVDIPQVAVTNGISPSIQLLVSQLVHPGDVVFMEDPGFSLGIRIARDLSLDPKGVPLDEDGLDVDSLAEAVKQARALIAAGEIGDIRFINAEYPQDWLATTIETSGQRQAAWRTDPTQAGKSNCVGDIGSHVENLVHYITGQRIKRLCARLDSFGPGRLLDDNASIMVEYASGAKGLYWSSQIACGNDNALRIRVYGTKGGLEWEQENPNYLKVSLLGQANAILSRGRDPFASTAQSFSRIPSGHPEGYFEAFANVYAAFCRSLQDKLQGRAASPDEADFPTVASGLAGVKFIGKCVESSQKGAVWVNLD